MQNDIKFVPFNGIWEQKDKKWVYKGKSPGHPHSFGEIISNTRIRNGTVKCRITFPSGAKDSSGRIIFKFSVDTRKYLSAGIGGYGKAYLLDELNPNLGWRAIKTVGDIQNLNNESYDVEIKFLGSRFQLLINNVKILNHDLLEDFDGDQFGFFAWGDNEVEFELLDVKDKESKVFVVMKFDEPYNSLYEKVIIPICDKCGYKAVRGDDVHRPGIILQDIISEIQEADIVIAEITPVNANVFYELGYAHALKKHTILLAERGNELPFDIRSYRVIFYDNSIKGKDSVEETLEKHLKSINEEF